MTPGVQPLAVRAVKPSVPPLCLVQRWRVRWLRRHVTRAQREALTFLPLAFSLIWNQGPMKGTTAPGVKRAMRRRSAGAMCRAYKLPSPVAFTVGRPQVECIVALPGQRNTLHVLVLMRPELAVPDRLRIEERITALNALFKNQGILLSASTASAVSHDTLASWLCYGALLGGELPEDWLTRAKLLTPTPSCVLTLARTAPTPLTSILPMLLLYRQSSFLGGTLLRFDDEMTTWGPLGNRPYADPELMLANWVSKDTALGALAFQSIRLAATLSSTRVLAADALGAMTGEPFSLAGKPRDRAFRLWNLADRLAVLATLGVRRVPKLERGPLRTWLREELGMNGIPRAFVGPLRFTIFEAWPTGPGKLYRRRRGQGVELVAANGLFLGRAASLASLRGRALARLAGPGATVTTTHDVASWAGRLASRLEHPVLAPTSLFYLRVRSRGRDAGFRLGRATFVRLHPHRRPTVHHLSPDEVMPALLRRLGTKDKVEITALRPEGTPIESALERLVAARSAGATSIGFGDAERAWLLEGSRVRHPLLESSCTRPRQILWTTEPPPPRPLRDRGNSGPRSIECRGALEGDKAALVWVDDLGRRMTERLSLDDLSLHLDETDSLLRSGGTPTILSTRLSPELLTLGVRRKNTGRILAPVEIEGTLPFALRVNVAGEWFGAGERYGIEAAAQVLLAKWPPGRQGLLSFTRIDIPNAAPVLLLYARSVVRRRLQVRLRQLEALNESNARAETFL